MASIQCAIELYDGVSPVLGTMAASLESLGGSFSQFSAALSIPPDTGGLALWSGALQALALEADTAGAALSALQATAAGLAGCFGADLFLPLLEGAGSAAAAMDTVRLAAEAAAAGIPPAFSAAAAAVGAGLDTMRVRAQAAFTGIGGAARACGASLPGCFAGPLNQIAGMFAAMAASARASVASIAGSARSALSAVSALNAAASRVSLSAFSIGSAGVQTPLRAAGMDAAGAAVIQLDAVERREPPAVQPAVSVVVHAENHIAAEADVDAVLRAFERKVADAVASGIEGVYA